MIYNPHITNATLRIANPEGQVDWGRYYHRNMFGDFLRNHERLDYSDLRYKEPGTPIVIRYSNRMFQFGIYGENRVIFQRCFSLGAVIFFSIERCSAKEFCERGQLYEYTPRYDFDKSVAYDNASYYYQMSQGNAIPASVELQSVYGDDFTLICMVGYEAFANAVHHCPTSSARDRGGICGSFLTGRQFRGTTNYRGGA